MIEVLFAMVILSTGLIALSSLAAGNLNGTANSRYMSLASTYASEKLEDLNHWPTGDPNVCAASGTTVGSLTSDVQSTNVNCNGITSTVNYYDEIQISDLNGQVCETVSGLSSGSTTYTATCHTSGGMVNSTTYSTTSAADANAIVFHRRWTIEMDQPVTGIRRVTVLVTLKNGYVQPPISFQMTMVRP